MKFQSHNYIQCISGSKASLNPDVGSSMAGSHGLKHMRCDGLTDVNTFDPAECFFEVLTSFSGRFEQGEQYIDHISGYFRAPVDGDYTFFAYGDDNTYLILNDGSQDLTLSSSDYYDTYGNSFANTPSQSVSLTAGTDYKIILKHKEGTSIDFS